MSRVSSIIGRIICTLFHRREAEWNAEEYRFRLLCPQCGRVY
jgi:hypothetical protein